MQDLSTLGWVSAGREGCGYDGRYGVGLSRRTARSGERFGDRTMDGHADAGQVREEGCATQSSRSSKLCAYPTQFYVEVTRHPFALGGERSFGTSLDFWDRATEADIAFLPKSAKTIPYPEQPAGTSYSIR